MYKKFLAQILFNVSIFFNESMHHMKIPAPVSCIMCKLWPFGSSLVENKRLSKIYIFYSLNSSVVNFQNNSPTKFDFEGSNKLFNPCSSSKVNYRAFEMLHFEEVEKEVL